MRVCYPRLVVPTGGSPDSLATNKKISPYSFKSQTQHFPAPTCYSIHPFQKRSQDSCSEPGHMYAAQGMGPGTHVNQQKRDLDLGLDKTFHKVQGSSFKATE